MGTRVAIIGAGIAGLTSSIALAQRGCSVDLIERSPFLEEIGAGIQLSPNAMAVLARLGLLRELSDFLFEPQSINIHDALQGRRLATIPLGATSRSRYGAPYCLIHRADLQRGLLAAVRRHGAIAIHLGTSAEDVRAKADAVAISAGGHELVSGILVAADGIHSRIRTDHFGYPGPRSLGRTAWRATIPATSVPRSIRFASTGLWLGPGAHLVHYPVASGKSLNVVVIAEGDGSAPPQDPFGRRVRRLIDAVPGWTRWPLAEIDPALPWVRGRVALIGDAAHAMPPTGAQGGAQAIEDAWVLADMLAGASDLGAALSRYDRVRRRRVARVARMARRNLTLYGLEGFPASMRDAVLRNMPTNLLLYQLDWLFGWRPEQNSLSRWNTSSP